MLGKGESPGFRATMQLAGYVLIDYDVLHLRRKSHFLDASQQVDEVERNLT